MKQLSVLALAVLSVARLGAAASCTGGTLATYVALGSTGCTIGGDTLTNFKTLSGISGGTALAPGSIMIAPSGSNFSPTLLFSTSQSASNGTPLEAIFTYDLSGPLFTGISALLGGSTVTMDGAVTGIVNYCEGGMFGSDGLSGCGFANSALVTLADGVDNGASGTFAGVLFLNVTDDLIIDPGLSGTATAGTLTNSFTAVPEPVSTALVGLGLTLAGAIKIRSLRAK